jgi:pimeloyl-ACP methyl ester carboxylesterase
MQYYASSDALKLAYRDEGAGLPVLCLAGLTRNSSDFDYVAPHLDDVRLIRADYRGRGASQWADDFMTYSVVHEAQDALALLDHLGLEKAAVLGTSRGGIIAMALAVMAPDRLIGVCLNDIGPEVAQAGRDNIMTYLGKSPPYDTRTEMVAALPGLMKGFQNVPASRWSEEVARHTAITPQGLALTYDPRLRDAVAQINAQPTPDMWPMFDALADKPLALIWGENSDLLSRDTVREMQHRRADMILASLPDRAHIPFLDEPDALRAIHQWIKVCQ